MVSNILSRLDATVCGEIAMVIFLAVFLAVGVRLAFMRRSECEQQAHIPLDDPATTGVSMASPLRTGATSTPTRGSNKRG